MTQFKRAKLSSSKRKDDVAFYTKALFGRMETKIVLRTKDKGRRSVYIHLIEVLANIADYIQILSDILIIEKQ